MMTARFDERQAKRLPEEVRDFHCFLSQAIATARMLLHLSNKLSFAWNSMTKTRRVDRCNGSNHQKWGGKDLG